MLRILKRVGEACYNAVEWVDATFCDTQAEHDERQREYLTQRAVAAGRLDDSHVDKKRKLANPPADGAGAAVSNSAAPVSTQAPGSSQAPVDAPAPATVELVAAESSSAASVQHMFATFADATKGVRASDIPSSSADPGGGRSGTEMYEGETLQQLLLSSADAGLVKQGQYGVMWDRCEGMWKHGHFHCRKAKRHADHSLRFQMNFTQEAPADAASALVELVHWLSVEDLSYIFDIRQRCGLLEEVKDIGMFGHRSVA